MFARFHGPEKWLTRLPRHAEANPPTAKQEFAIENLEDRTVPAASDLFVSSVLNDAIVRIDQTGQSIYVSGNNIDSPRQVLFINNTECFLASFNNDVILRVDGNGSQQVFAAAGNIDNPSGMAFDSNGNLIVANFTNNTIVRLDPLGNQTVLTTGGNINGRDGSRRRRKRQHLRRSFFNNRIVKIDTGNNQTVLTTGGDLVGPQQIALDNNGNLIVASTVNDRILRVDANTGTQTVVAAGGFLSGPSGVAVDDDGTILVASILNNSVVRIDTQQGTQTLVSSGNSLQAPSFLTLGPQIPTVTFSSGVLTIVGTDGDDEIEIDDHVDVSVNNISFGSFSHVERIVVLMKGGDDVLRVLDPIYAPFTINGGEGNDTLDLSDVYGQVTTYVGPNNDADSQFISIENLSTGHTIFVAGAQLAGTIDSHGQALDFSRLTIPVTLLLDANGNGTVNGSLVVFNVGRYYLPLFQNNVLGTQAVLPAALGLEQANAEESDEALTVGDPSLDDEDTSDERGERWFTANSASTASGNGETPPSDADSPEAVDAALEANAFPKVALGGEE
ncbi:MAG: NHL repeat-containing protein [Planctomycetota bacterium]